MIIRVGYIGIWMNQLAAVGSNVPSNAILDAINNPILDAAGNFILSA